MAERRERPIVPVLAGLIYDQEGKLLIARRKAALANGGKWEFPGGKLQRGESPEACLEREIAEELGIEIVVERPYAVVQHDYPAQSILLISYICRFCGGEWRLTDHDRVEWRHAAQLAGVEFSAADVPIVDKITGND